MYKKLYLFIPALLLLFATSCVDEIYENFSEGNEVCDFDGTLTFGLSAGEVLENSRIVNTASGGNISIANLWVGIYDAETGNRIASEYWDAFRTSVYSGTRLINAIHMRLTLSGEAPKVYIVGVANYDGVYTASDQEELIDKLNEASTMDEFAAIDIDTESAYAGNKGANPNSNAPLMMGYFQSSVGSLDRPLYDQFVSGPGNPKLAPDEVGDRTPVQLRFKPGTNTISLDDGVLCLKRLVSTSRVVLTAPANFTIKNVYYKRFYMPKQVYLAERRVIKDPNYAKTFSDFQKYSPNSADRLISEGKYDLDEISDAYYYDTDWQLASRDFTFQHFENKHWAFGSADNFEDRERLNDKGFTNVLCPDGKEYNNFASYFILRMQVYNSKTNTSADLQYVIHEGMSNDEFGFENLSWKEDYYNDFTSLRNQKYTYNVTVNGFEDIIVNVDSSSDHSVGQSGNIWSWIYAEENNPNAYKPADIHAIEVEGKTYNNFLKLTKDANIAFRLYGVDPNGKKIDVVYNMSEDMNMSLAASTLYPGTSETVYISDINELRSVVGYSNLLNAFSIGDGSTYYNLEDFVKNASSASAKNYHLKLNEYKADNADGFYIGPRRNFMRALYIIDLNTLKNDPDGCTKVGTVYAAEQYPGCRGEMNITLTNDDILWPGDYNDYVYPNTPNRFFGTAEGGVVATIKYKSYYQGFRFRIKDSATATTAIEDITVKEKLPGYKKTFGYQSCYHYPISTAKVRAPESHTDYVTKYIEITPEYDKDYYYANPANFVAFLYDQTWVFTDNVWNTNLRRYAMQSPDYDNYVNGTKSFTFNCYGLECLGGRGLFGKLSTPWADEYENYLNVPIGKDPGVPNKDLTEGCLRLWISQPGVFGISMFYENTIGMAQIVPALYYALYSSTGELLWSDYQRTYFLNTGNSNALEFNYSMKKFNVDPGDDVCELRVWTQCLLSRSIAVLHATEIAYLSNERLEEIRNGNN